MGPDPVFAKAVPVPPVLHRLVVELVDRKLVLTRGSLGRCPATIDFLGKLNRRKKQILKPFICSEASHKEGIGEYFA